MPPIPSLSIVVPVYNEGNLLNETLPQILAFLEGYHAPTELLISDDGSGEVTSGIEQAFARSHPEGKTKVILLAHPTHRGKGAVVRDGLLAAQGDYIGFLDADLQLPVYQMLKLAAALETCEADIAIGSRRVPGARLLDAAEKKDRGLFGRLLNHLVRAFFIPGIYDTQCGIKLMRRAPLQPVITLCRTAGFMFDVELLYRASLRGLKIVEVPVLWHYRGASTVRLLRHGVAAIRDLIRLRLWILRENM